mmetsp:Transcript_85323/g.150678  ORF Transcript_85323/g.150678 Transcript_85323/m.150678 type:complete len:335 (-) Transcript_85323:351-1355(-)
MFGKGMPEKHSNVFVGNLTGDTTEDRLKNAFVPYGSVVSCRVVTKDGKTSGFVKMGDTAAAESAINALNGVSGLIVKFANFDVGGRQKMLAAKGGWEKGGFIPMKGGFMKGGWGAPKGWGKGGWGGGGKGGWGGFGSWAPLKLPPREEEPEKPEGPPSDNLYVKHLPVGITEEDVKATFGKCGEVADCRLLRPDYSLEWAALVRMTTPEQAATARQSLDNGYPEYTVPALMVKQQTKNGSSVEDHCYIKNVPTNTTEAKLTAVFAKFGEVKWVSVLPPATNWRVGPSSTALVQMSNKEECEKAIEALNDVVPTFSDFGATMKVRFALPKDKPAA